VPRCQLRERGYRSTSKLLRRSATIPDGPVRHNRSRSRVEPANLNDLAVHRASPRKTIAARGNFGQISVKISGLRRPSVVHSNIYH